MKQCVKCGEWYQDEEIGRVCQECGSEQIVYYDDSEICDRLNDYEALRQSLKVVETENGYEIVSKLGKQKKGELTAKFMWLAHKVDISRRLTNDIWRVVNLETKEDLFVGSREDCEKYIKKHETMWKELKIKEWFKR